LAFEIVPSLVSETKMVAYGTGSFCMFVIFPKTVWPETGKERHRPGRRKNNSILNFEEIKRVFSDIALLV
jgi:hypothetical protein